MHLGRVLKVVATQPEEEMHPPPDFSTGKVSPPDFSMGKTSSISAEPSRTSLGRAATSISGTGRSKEGTSTKKKRQAGPFISAGQWVVVRVEPARKRRVTELLLEYKRSFLADEYDIGCTDLLL